MNKDESAHTPEIGFNLGLANQIKPGVVEDVAKDVYDYLAETMR